MESSTWSQVHGVKCTESSAWSQVHGFPFASYSWSVQDRLPSGRLPASPALVIHLNDSRRVCECPHVSSSHTPDVMVNTCVVRNGALRSFCPKDSFTFRISWFIACLPIKPTSHRYFSLSSPRNLFPTPSAAKEIPVLSIASAQPYTVRPFPVCQFQ